MDPNEVKANAFLKKAKSKITIMSSFWAFLFGSSTGMEEAIEYYKRAGNLFKMAKKWNMAGKALVQAANLLDKISQNDAPKIYLEAASCFKKSDLPEAVSCIMQATQIYTDIGRFAPAAKNHVNIAELYEHEGINFELAMKHYELAADYFKCEDSNSKANKCSLKVAHYAALLQDYEKAIKIYEGLAKTSLENSLLKYAAKEYYFKALLCHLCVDFLNGKHALKKYLDESPPFSDSRECKLVQLIIKNIEEENVDGFTEAINYYDSVSRLDKWYITVLLHIKRTFTDYPDLR